MEDLFEREKRRGERGEGMLFLESQELVTSVVCVLCGFDVIRLFSVVSV